MQFWCEIGQGAERRFAIVARGLARQPYGKVQAVAGLAAGGGLDQSTSSAS
jgi:hypothetical protein